MLNKVRRWFVNSIVKMVDNRVDDLILLFILKRSFDSLEENEILEFLKLLRKVFNLNPSDFKPVI